MDIKKMIKNSKNNDVFAKKIQSENEEFNSRYWLFVRSIPNIFSIKSKIPMFRVMITREKELPNSLEEMNKLEYVQVGIEDYIYAQDNQKENSIDKQILCPDEFGYLPIFREGFIPTSERNYPEDLIYLGNYDLDLPKFEYILNEDCILSTTFWRDVDTVLIENYLKYNKRNPSIYNHELAERRRKNYLLNKKIHEQVEKHSEWLIANYGDEIEKILAEEPYTEDSLTYVGPNDEENQ